MIRYTVEPEHAPQVDAAIEALFAAVRREQPAGVRFWYGRLAAGATYVGLLELDDGADNPLPTLPEGRQLQAALRRHGAPPPEPVMVLGSYRPG